MRTKIARVERARCEYGGCCSDLVAKLRGLALWRFEPLLRWVGLCIGAFGDVEPEDVILGEDFDL